MTARWVLGCILGAATSVLGAEANLSNFKPASGMDGIVGVEGARPWESASPIDLKLLVDYGRNPMSRPGAGLIEYRTGMWLSAELHVIEPLTLAIQVPFTVQERGLLAMQPAGGQQVATSSGLGDIRITPRIGILRQEQAWVDLAVQASLELATSADNLLTTWSEPSAEGLLALGHRFYFGESDAALLILGNAFGFTAPDRTVDGKTIGAGYGGRAGAAIETGRKNLIPSRLFGEIETKTMPRNAFDDGYTPTEWRGGASWCFGPGLSLDVAAGAGINNSPGTPDWRLVSAIGYGSNTCGVAREKRILAEKAAAERALAEKRAAEEAARLAAIKEAADKAAAEEDARLAAEKAALEKAEAERLALEAAAAAAARDTDGDGVPDLQDNCRTEAGPADNQGCPPAQKQVVVITRTALQILDRVQFASGKAAIAKRSHKLLDQVAAVLQGHPEIAKVEVQGHTDDTGNLLTNMVLSQARAEAVVNYLTSKGVAPERLQARGFGPSQPIADNAARAGREANRRVEFKVLASEEAY